MIRLRLAALSIAAAALFAASGPVLAQSAESSVTLTFDTGADTGTVMVALFDSAETYASGRHAAQRMLDVAAGEKAATFDDLPAGDYAAKAFHDVDGNGAMNTNPFGIPTEPYAFSNNAVGNMGPASWERARFTVSGPTAQTIRLR